MENMEKNVNPERTESKKRKGKKITFKTVLICAGAILCALSLAALAVFISSLFVKIGDVTVKTSSETLDFSDAGLTDFSPFLRCTELKELDLHGNDLSVEEYHTLQDALPECDINWDVPFCGGLYDSDAAEITLDSAVGLTAEELDALSCFLSLEKFSAKGFGMADELTERLNGLCTELPECDILWDIPVNETLYPAETEILALPAVMTKNDFSRLGLFRNLKGIDASALENASEFNEELAALTSEQGFVWNINILGKEYPCTETTLDLSDSSVPDPAALSRELFKFPFLEHVELCRCNLSYDAMDMLIADHPDVKFVFTISFVRWTDVRTDILAFSSLAHMPFWQDETHFEPLFKYCTDLVALDIGHYRLKDISALANLKHLKVLDLADNRIEDISVFEKLPELEFLELSWYQGQKIDSLAKLPNLRILNLTFARHINDFEPLYHLNPNIEMLWLQNSHLTADMEKKVKELYPNTKISLGGNTCWGNGWEKSEDRLNVKKAFNNWPYVIEYDSIDNIKYQEGVTLTPGNVNGLI